MESPRYSDPEHIDFQPPPVGIRLCSNCDVDPAGTGELCGNCFFGFPPQAGAPYCACVHEDLGRCRNRATRPDFKPQVCSPCCLPFGCGPRVKAAREAERATRRAAAIDETTRNLLRQGDDGQGGQLPHSGAPRVLAEESRAAQEISEDGPHRLKVPNRPEGEDRTSSKSYGGARGNPCPHQCRLKGWTRQSLTELKKEYAHQHEKYPSVLDIVGAIAERVGNPNHTSDSGRQPS